MDEYSKEDMEFIEKYNNYPYKKLFAVADTFNYPLSIIEKIMKCHVNGYYDCETEFYETLTKIVLVSLNYNLNYIFTNESEFLNKVYELNSKYVKNQNTYIGASTRNIMENYILK